METNEKYQETLLDIYSTVAHPPTRPYDNRF